MAKAGATSGKSASPAKRKPARRTRITSEAPDGEQVEEAAVNAADATVAEGDAEGDDERPKNEFIDDEAVEDNDDEEPEDDDMADFIDDSEPTDGKDEDDNVTTAEGGATNAHAQLSGTPSSGDLCVDATIDKDVLAQAGAKDGDHADDSDGEHSAHSLMIRSAQNNADDSAATTLSVVPSASPEALMDSAETDDELEFDGVRPAAQYFGGFKPNLASKNYQTLLRDAISQRIGISDYAYANGAYKTVHVYNAFPDTSSSAWKPVGATDFPDVQESIESLYPAFSTMKIICDTMNFSAFAGYINLARTNPSRLSFSTGDQKKDGMLGRVNDPTAPAHCITIGLVRQCFIGPNGLEIQGGYRRGITLAPFESEAYRAVACLNKVADMKGPEHFTFPLYSYGGFAFTTKTMSRDGNRPTVPGWTTSQTVKRGRPELVSDRSTARRKPGVLGYVDEIPVIDARRKRVVWGTDTLAQIVDSQIWPRYIGNLERDSVAVVVYTVNRWGRENMDQIAFNIHSVVLVADPLETTSANAAAKIRRDYLATKDQPSKKRLTHERPSEGGSGPDPDGGKKAKTAE